MKFFKLSSRNEMWRITPCALNPSWPEPGVQRANGSGLVWSIWFNCAQVLPSRRIERGRGRHSTSLVAAVCIVLASRWTRSDSGTLRGIWHFVFLISVCGTECCWYCWYYVPAVLLLRAACGRGRVRLRDTRRARTGLFLQPPTPPSPSRLSTRPHGHPRLIRLTIAAPGVRT